MDGRRPRRSLVIPMRDEAARIEATVARLAAGPLAGDGVEVLFVDDGSDDESVAVARAAIAGSLALDARVVDGGRRAGKGAAVRAGMVAAAAPVRVFVDADLPVDDADVERCFAVLEAGAADVVHGSRAHPASTVARRQPAARVVSGRAFNVVVRGTRLVTERDTQCGLKGATADAVAVAFAPVEIDGFAFDVEVLARARTAGLRVAAVPVTWRHVPTEGGVGLAGGLRAVRDVLALRRRLA